VTGGATVAGVVAAGPDGPPDEPDGEVGSVTAGVVVGVVVAPADGDPADVGVPACPGRARLT
jgi:hypothetical protein